MSIFSKITWIDQIKDALGNIIQQGTPVSANNMNRIEQGVKDAADELEEIKTGSQKVGDAEKLDGVDSLDYARTDTAETFENNVFINGDLQLGYDGLIGDREIKLWAENGYNVKMLAFETPTHGMGIRYNANDNILYIDRYPNQTTPIPLAKFYRDLSKIDFSVTDLQQNGNKIWHAGNDGAGSGLDADKLDGKNSDVSSGVNTIVVRDASGNITVATKLLLSNGDAIRFDDSANMLYLDVDGGTANGKFDNADKLDGQHGSYYAKQSDMTDSIEDSDVIINNKNTSLTYTSGDLSKVIEYWENGTTKRKETDLVYSGGNLSTVTMKVYNTAGTLQKTITETLNYTTGNLTSVERAVS